MLSSLSGVLLAFAPVLQADAAAELQTAVSKIAQAESLRFEVLAENSGSSGAGGMNSGMGGYTEAVGVWKKGLPLQLNKDEVVAFKQGEKIVHKDKAGQWKVLEMPAGFGVGAPRPSERTQKTTSTSTSFGSMDTNAMGLMSLTWVQDPVGALTDFSNKVEDVRKATEDGATVFTGKLTAKAAEAMLPRDPPAAGADLGAEPPTEAASASGTFTITVKDGAVTKAAFVVARAVKAGDREFVATRKNTFAIKQVGEVALEVPPEVLTLFK